MVGLSFFPEEHILPAQGMNIDIGGGFAGAYGLRRGGAGGLTEGDAAGACCAFVDGDFARCYNKTNKQ